MSRGKGEHYNRERSRQSYKSESKSGMSALVQLPAKCNLQDLPANDSRHSAGYVELDVTLAERSVGIVGVGYLRALSR